MTHRSSADAFCAASHACSGAAEAISVAEPPDAPVEIVVHDLFKRQLLQHIPRLRGFALSLTHDSARADDLVQDVLLRAWRARDSFELGTNLHAWLFRILRNAFYNDAVVRRRDVQDVDGVHAARLRADASQEWRIRWQEMLRALQELKPHAREALLMIAAAGMSYEEAAAICNCPVGTMKSRVKRARAELAERIGFELAEPVGAQAVDRRCA